MLPRRLAPSPLAALDRAAEVRAVLAVRAELPTANVCLALELHAAALAEARRRRPDSPGNMIADCEAAVRPGVFVGLELSIGGRS